MNEQHAKRVILIAEDDLPLLEALTDRFLGEGLEVVKAKDGKEAIDLCLKEVPDLLLLDILMPEKSGIEVMKQVRTYPWGRELPIILLTNVDPDEGILKEISDVPPAYYLIKSDTDIDEVLTKVRSLLSI